MPPPTNTPNPAAKRRKCFIYIALAILLQTLIIVAFVLIFMRIKSPKLRFRSVTVDSLTSNSASFNARLTGEVAVKNVNFGKFKYPESTVSFLYRGSSVGTARIPSGRAKARDTEKLNVTVAVEAKNDRNLGGDLSSGKITLSSKATVEGKVHLFNVIKRKKTATMDCTMDVDTKTRVVQNLRCD
ncbi:late embryogenesis abundant protein At1g64065-like [Salvia hispanica]|uniref:late embryogenesis abundant protein At1g64065-like n=1 Tax=Salvia hispanica TaxID=49212 RepID=UPI002009C291|nr:late embryogenesis abundant protein At1g64065-like [Salvia hispanica]